MKKVKNAFLLSLFLLLLAGCSMEEVQPVPQDTNDVILKKADKDHYIPFHATLEAYVEQVLQYGPPKIQIVLGEGNATHMGKTDVFMKQWWIPPQPPPGPPPFSLPYTGTGWGEVILTAANGDRLYASYIEGEGLHEVDMLVYVTFTAYFNGGTGRFEDALGYFVWDGVFDPATNLGEVTCMGEIMY